MHAVVALFEDNAMGMVRGLWGSGFRRSTLCARVVANNAEFGRLDPAGPLLPEGGASHTDQQATNLKRNFRIFANRS